MEKKKKKKLRKQLLPKYPEAQVSQELTFVDVPVDPWTHPASQLHFPVPVIPSLHVPWPQSGHAI